jgi:hypothetical protein
MRLACVRTDDFQTRGTMDTNQGLNALDRRRAECPYCKSSLRKIPAAKTKCPHCGEYMFVRTRPLDGTRTVVTAEEARCIEADWVASNDMRWWIAHSEEVRNTYPNFSPHMPDEDWFIPHIPDPERDSSVGIGIRIGGPNRQAAYWARRRAAELVGMVRDTAGGVLPNPDPRWTITETARKKIREVIATGFDGELQPLNGGERPPYLKPGENRECDVIDHIKTALDDEYGISLERGRLIRARLITATEIMRAQIGSNLNVWRKTGVVRRIRWSCAGSDSCDDCAKNDGVEIEFGHPFPSGAYSPLDTHPLCRCILVATEFNV